MHEQRPEHDEPPISPPASASPRRSPLELWTSGQRAALVALVACLLVYVVVRYARTPSYVPNPQPAEPPRAADLADRIDPNTADWETLSALPQLGEKRARAIVEYRDGASARRPGEVVFRSPQDLLRVRGIGAATVEQVQPFLKFPTTATTAPSSGG